MNDPALRLQVDEPVARPRFAFHVPRSEGPASLSPQAHPDVAWEPPGQGRVRTVETWREYMTYPSSTVGRFHGQVNLEGFVYVQSARPQPDMPRRLRRAPATVADDHVPRPSRELARHCRRRRHAAAADRNQIAHVRQWLDGDLADGAHPSVLHAAPRDPYPGKPIPFPPASAQL